MFIAPVPLFQKSAKVDLKNRRRRADQSGQPVGTKRNVDVLSSVVAGDTGSVWQLGVSRLLKLCHAQAEEQAGFGPTGEGEGAGSDKNITPVNELVSTACNAHRILPKDNTHLSIV